jgi:hypothetical protein
MQETTQHLLSECNYVEVYWNLLAARIGLGNYGQMRLLGGPSDWVSFLSGQGSKNTRKQNLGYLFSF